MVNFCEALAEAANLFVASIMVLIDGASRDDSNGCHIVFLSNLASAVKFGLSA